MTTSAPEPPSAAGPAEPPPAPSGGGPQYTGGPQYSGGPQYTPAPQFGPPTAQIGGYGPRPPAPAEASTRVGTVALVLAGIGAVLGVIAFTAVRWFSGADGWKFSDIHRIVTDSQTKPLVASVAKAYFGWLAWLLLAVVVVAAVLAAIPRLSAPFRAVGVLAAVGSIVLSFLAIKLFSTGSVQTSSQFDGYSTYLKHARVGFWMAVAAFLIAGIGAAIGASRRT